MTLENQRYGRNKLTLVNKTYMESGEYRRKFDNISENKDIDKTLYNCAKQILNHRSGTVLEDMYWNNEKGIIVASELNQTSERMVKYSNKTKATVEKSSEFTLVTIHNHPGSMPPSVSDFNSSFVNKYRNGFVVCHNGMIFKYKSHGIIDEELYSAYIAATMNEGISEYNAQIAALENFQKNRLIEFEVI